MRLLLPQAAGEPIPSEIYQSPLQEPLARLEPAATKSDQWGMYWKRTQTRIGYALDDVQEIGDTSPWGLNDADLQA